MASCCLLAALLGAAAANAQASGIEDPGVQLGAEVGVSYGLVPEFEGEDAGGSTTYTGLVTARVHDRVGVSFLMVGQTIDHPAPGTPRASVLDPRLSLAFLPNLLEGTGLKLSPSVRFLFGMSEASRTADYLGSVRPAASLSKELGLLRVTVGGSFTKHVRRYTLAADGTSNVTHTTAGRLGLDLSLPADLSLGTYVEMRRSARYEGEPSHSYENGVSLGFQANEHLSLGLDLTTTDAQLDAGGHANNELDLYRQGKTELAISASYAL